MSDTTSKDDELDELLEKIQLLTGSRFYDYETKETARRLLKQYGIQERTDELHGVGNCAVDCGSTSVMDYVDFRLTILKDKGTE